MGSVRFPGKMLASLAGRPVLEWVLRRADRAQVDKVVLATTDLARDDPLQELAESLAVPVYRGSEFDVLERFAGAANTFDADTVIRVCADNPFVDPAEIDRLINYFLENRCDYACNHQDRIGSRYADGFGAEILSNDLLQKIADVACEARHREHVTLYLWDHADDFALRSVPAPAELAFPQLRFDVDTPGDLDYLNRVAKTINIDTGVAATKIIQAALSIATEADHGVHAFSSYN